MTLILEKILEDALRVIDYDPNSGVHRKYPLHQEEVSISEKPKDYRDHLFPYLSELILARGRENGEIQDTINNALGTNFGQRGNCQQDCTLYAILFEAHASIAMHGDYNFPSKIELWIGKAGFIVGVQQKGRGFNADEISRTGKHREGGGSGFKTYKELGYDVFFDNPTDARTVYIMRKIQAQDKLPCPVPESPLG